MENQENFEICVCGQKAVFALAEKNPQKIERFFFNKEMAPKFGQLCSRLASEKKIYRLVENDELEKIADSVHHQGLAAFIRVPAVSEPTQERVELWAKEGRLVLVLDGVANNHNLGTIARTAAFLGIKDIVVSGRGKDSSRILSPAVYRTAEGAMEEIDLWEVKNTEEFLAAHPFGKPSGLLAVAADQYGKIDARDLPAHIKKLPGANSDGGISGSAIALVLGNEEFGLSRGVLAKCLLTVSITGSGALESLNVAQAAAIFMFLLSKPGKKKVRVFTKSREAENRGSGKPERTNERSGPSQLSRGSDKTAKKSVTGKTGKVIRTVRLKKTQLDKGKN